MADDISEGMVPVASVTFDDTSDGDEKAQDNDGNSYHQESFAESSFVNIVPGVDAPDAEERVHSDTVASFDILQSVSMGH